MPSELEVAWLAGLLEGEGTYYVSAPKNGKRASLTTKLKMSDCDVVERAAALFPGKGKVRNADDPRPNHQTCFVKCWHGADAERVMRAVFPYMGKRRSAKIRECLATPNLSHQPKVKA